MLILEGAGHDLPEPLSITDGRQEWNDADIAVSSRCRRFFQLAMNGV